MCKNYISLLFKKVTANHNRRLSSFPSDALVKLLVLINIDIGFLFKPFESRMSGFLKLLSSAILVCVWVGVSIQGYKLLSHDIKPVQSVEQVCCV